VVAARPFAAAGSSSRGATDRRGWLVVAAAPVAAARDVAVAVGLATRLTGAKAAIRHRECDMSRKPHHLPQ
jgi:hypothetical protein